jgi:hypothetical protein
MVHKEIEWEGVNGIVRPGIGTSGGLLCTFY